jgi:hypothetical protein
MIVKGVPLAILAYGEPGMKESSDIDLLVNPGTADEARRLLIEHGYEVSLDKLTSRQFERHVQHSTEAGFFNPRTGVKVDLHWRLVANGKLLSNVTAEGPAQQVAVPGGSLRTLSDDALFAYLCLHGALHNWSRLKWLADLGAFLSQRSGAEIVALYDAAAAYNVGRSTTTALLLCRELLGLSFEDHLLEALEKDTVARHLAANAVAGLVHGRGVVEHASYTAPWLRTTIAQFFIVPNMGHVFDQLKLTWHSPVDRTRIELPRGLEFGYHLLRVPLWLGRIGKRAFRGAAI